MDPFPYHTLQFALLYLFFQTKPILGPGSIAYIMMDIQYRFHQQVCDEQSLIDFFKAAKIQYLAECFVWGIPVHCPCDAGVGVMGEVKGLSAVRCKLGFTFPATTLRTTQTLLSAAVKTSACQLKPPKH